MTIETLFWLYLAGGVVGLLLLYGVVRGAIISAFKTVEIWKAKGGVQAALDAEAFARTGIRTAPRDDQS